MATAGANSRSRAQRTYVGGNLRGPGDLPAHFLREFHECWAECQEKIDALQNQKKAMLANVRSRYGRHQAEAVRITMRMMEIDATKRAELNAFSDMARRYVDLLETEIEARQYEH